MEDMVSQQSLQAYYNGKKVFLTGHTGFKGTWLLKILSLLGAEVKGYALEPQSKDDLFISINGASVCNSVIADIRDKQRLEDELLMYQPDIVFHLAAQPLVRLSYEIPLATFEANTLGTANLLEAIRKLDKKCQVVLITTDKVYHNHEWEHPYKEEDRLGGYDPYSASKGAAELVIDSYRNSFFNSNNYQQHKKGIAVARAGNVIGGGDWSKDRLVPDIVRALSAKETIKVRNPLSVRPWQHVLEPLFGYLVLALKLEEDPVLYSQAYNFGPYPEDILPVEKFVQIAIENWGSGEYENAKLTDQPHEAGLLRLDINKAGTELKWKPLFDSALSIQRTIQWYKHFVAGKNALQLTVDDIDFYFTLFNNAAS
jgi:CDP-glucose 4,6-dehydratase